MTICTTNADKAALLGACVASLGFDARHVARELHEPQGASIAAVARAKLAEAFAALGGPILVEDSGLEIAALNGFPGPYTKYALATLGARGLIALAAGQPCRFTSAIALARRDGSIAVGEHGIDGAIATADTGSDVWNVFVPPLDRRAQLAAWRDEITGWLAGVDLR